MYVEVGRRIAERIHALKQLLKNMNLLSNEKRGRKREKKRGRNRGREGKACLKVELLRAIHSLAALADKHSLFSPASCTLLPLAFPVQRCM